MSNFKEIVGVFGEKPGLDVLGTIETHLHQDSRFRVETRYEVSLLHNSGYIKGLEGLADLLESESKKIREYIKEQGNE